MTEGRPKKPHVIVRFRLYEAFRIRQSREKTLVLMGTWEEEWGVTV